MHSSVTDGAVEGIVQGIQQVQTSKALQQLAFTGDLAVLTAYNMKAKLLGAYLDMILFVCKGGEQNEYMPESNNATMNVPFILAQ